MDPNDEENNLIEREMVETNFCNINNIPRNEFKNTIRLFIANYKDNIKGADYYDYKNWDIPAYFKDRLNQGNITTSFLEKLDNFNESNAFSDTTSVATHRIARDDLVSKVSRDDHNVQMNRAVLKKESLSKTKQVDRLKSESIQDLNDKYSIYNENNDEQISHVSLADFGDKTVVNAQKKSMTNSKRF